MIESDETFKKCLNKNLSKNSLKVYKQSAKLFCELQDKTFTEVVETIKDSEYGEIIDGYKIKPYNPDEGLINTYFEDYVNYMIDKELSESTIKVRVQSMRNLFNQANIILPKSPVIEVPKKRLNLLTQEDINYVLSISTIHYQSLICLMGSTGLRLGDCLNLTIADFMIATSRYHNFTNVEDFIKNAPSDMIGYWELYPEKTKRKGMICKVCNTPESSNKLLLSLRMRQESIDKINKEKNKCLKLEMEDSLFGSRQQNFKKCSNVGSISILLSRKNNPFQEHKRRQLKEKLEKEEINLKQHQDQINNIPKFHAHALRHYFISVLNAYEPNKTIALLMECHRSDVKTHEHYIGQSEELYSEDMIREHYQKLIPYLTFDKHTTVEDHKKQLMNEEKIKEYEEKIANYDEKQSKLNKKYIELSKQFEEILNS